MASTYNAFNIPSDDVIVRVISGRLPYWSDDDLKVRDNTPEWKAREARVHIRRSVLSEFDEDKRRESIIKGLRVIAEMPPDMRIETLQDIARTIPQNAYDILYKITIGEVIDDLPEQAKFMGAVASARMIPPGGKQDRSLS